MKLPRWTAYLALAALGVVLVTAIPNGEGERPEKGAAAAARNGGAEATAYPRLVVLGIDGLDPDTLRDVVERHPDRMPNFARLIAEADGVRDLGTSTPPQSPVAWSNFIVGRGPGGGAWVGGERGAGVELGLPAGVALFASRSPAVPPLETLRMATLNGARAMGWSGLAGTMAAGAWADLLAVPSSGTAEDALAGLVHGALKPAGTFVGGRRIVGEVPVA